MSNNPFWKTRRLAARALRAYERTKDLNPTIGAYRHTLVPAATAFVATYDRLRVLSQRRATERAEGMDAIERLSRLVRGWTVQVEALGTIEGFVATSYMEKASVPDDVLADAGSFLESVREHVAVNPESIPYAEDLITDVEAALDEAQREWTEAEQVRSEYATAVQANKRAEEALHPFLLAFRRTLAAVLGTNSPEYQALRANRISRQDEEDEALSLPEAANGESPPATDTGEEAPTQAASEADSEANSDESAEKDEVTTQAS